MIHGESHYLQIKKNGKKKLCTEVNLPSSGRPSKIPPRAQRQLIQEVTQDPRTTLMDPYTVHDSTIRKIPAKNGKIGNPED